MSGLANRVVLITGAAGGIGRAVVAAVAADGGWAIAADADERALDTLRRELEPAGAALPLDVASEAAWETAESEIRERFGRLDGLVTCAARMLPDDGGVDESTADAWRETLDVNLTGAWHASRVAIRLMRPRRAGSIVHVGSTVARLGSATAQPAYTASKGAVVALARELAVAHARDGIRVNVVSPGLIATPLTQALHDAPAARRRRLAHIPLGRLGEPADVAAAVTWLLSDASTYVTGAELMVDGGITAAFVTGNE